MLYQLRGTRLFNCGVGLFGPDFRTGVFIAHMAASLIAYFAIDSYAGSLMTAHSDGTELAYTVGCVLTCLLFPLLFTYRHVWIIFFVFALAMGVCAIFAPQLRSHNPEVLLGSLSRIGRPLCIYTLVCAQRSIAGHDLLKKSTVVFIICSPLTTLSSRLIRAAFPEALSVVAFVYVPVVVVAFLTLSPFSYKHLFSAAWISDMYRGDMRPLSNQVGERSPRFCFRARHGDRYRASSGFRNPP